MRRRRRQQTEVTPLPEAIAAGPWRIERGMPMVDLQDRIMSVPLDQTETAKFLRAHEMAHVKITPHKPAHQLAAEAGASMTAIQSVEDFRVHEFLALRNFARPATMTAAEALSVMQRVTDIKLAASLLLAIYNCSYSANNVLNAINNCSNFSDAVKKTIVDIVADVANMFYRRVAAAAPLRVLETPEGFEAVTAPVARYFDSLFAGDDLISIADYGALSHKTTSTWGTLEPIVRLPLKTAKKNKFGHQRVWRDEGVVPTAVYRLTVDNKVFSRKKKAASGTVLIDASGSMNFNDEDLAELVATAPGATVAVYAGACDYGRLVIVAANGKMADKSAIERALTPRPPAADSSDDSDDDSDPYCLRPMCGNVVDGPALEWLGRQPGPRIWVSDGLVTGVYDEFANNLRAEAVATMQQRDIERIEDWQELIDSFK